MARRKKERTPEEVARVKKSRAVFNQQEVSNEEAPQASNDSVQVAEMDREVDGEVEPDGTLITETAEEKEVLDAEEQRGEDEGEQPKVANTVVHSRYKDRYAANAAAVGASGKAPKRSNWDWLSQAIAKECLNDKHQINIDKFLGILEANGIDHTKWPNRNRGWEGRLRMTGRVVLQKVVANRGKLLLPDDRMEDAPAEFIEKYKTKA